MSAGGFIVIIQKRKEAENDMSIVLFTAALWLTLELHQGESLNTIGSKTIFKCWEKEKHASY